MTDFRAQPQHAPSNASLTSPAGDLDQVEAAAVEGEAKLEAHFKSTKVKDGEDGQAFEFFMSSHAVGQDEDGEWETSLTVNPQQREKVNFTEQVLALVREYYDRGQYISTAPNSKYNAFSTFEVRPEIPTRS